MHHGVLPHFRPRVRHERTAVPAWLAEDIKAYAVARRAFRARNRLAEFGVTKLEPQPKRPHDARQWQPKKAA